MLKGDSSPIGSCGESNMNMNVSVIGAIGFYRDSEPDYKYTNNG